MDENGHSNGANGCAHGSNGTARRIVGRPFPKGVSGNPGGRKRGIDFPALVRSWLEDGDKGRLLEAFENLLENDPKVLFHYAYGKPMENAGQAIEILTLEERKRRVALVFGLTE